MDDPRKLPSDLALTDWDKLLDDFEPTPPADDQRAAVIAVPQAPASDRPTRAVPSNELLQRDAIDLAFDNDGEEDSVLTPGRLLDDPTPSYASSESPSTEQMSLDAPESSERTVVGKIPALILEDAIRAGGTGLGQLFRPSQPSFERAKTVDPTRASEAAYESYQAAEGAPSSSRELRGRPGGGPANVSDAKTAPPSYEASVLTSAPTSKPSVLPPVPRPSSSHRKAAPVTERLLEPPSPSSQPFDLRELLPSSLPVGLTTLTGTGSLPSPDRSSEPASVPPPASDAPPSSARPIPPPRVAFAPPALSLTAGDGTDAAAPLSAASWSDERDAVVHLVEAGRLEEWQQRARWLEDEARRRDDRLVRSRLLLSVSELLAMSGEEERAEPFAKEARELAPNLPLAHRQARARSARNGAFAQLLPALDAETRLAPTPEARIHGALLGAELCRLVLEDPEGATKRAEQATRAMPNDPRPHVARIVALLAAGSPTKMRWPDAEGLAPLMDAFQELLLIRGVGDVPPQTASVPSPVASLAQARRALSAGDLSTASRALAALGTVAGVGTGAGWLAAMVAMTSAEGRLACIPWLQDLRQRAEQGSLAARMLARVTLELGQDEVCRALVDEDNVFSPAEKLAFAVLYGAEADVLGSSLELVRQEPSAAALVATLDALEAADHPVTVRGLDRRSRTATHLLLGRALGHVSDEAVALLHDAAAVDGSAPLFRVMDLDRSLVAGVAAEVAALVASWPFPGEPPHDFVCDRSLAAALLFVLADDPLRAATEANHAYRADPSREAAVRLRFALAPGDGAEAGDAPEALRALAAAAEVDEHRALLLLEAVRSHVAADPDELHRRLQEVADAAPALPFATAWGLELARQAGDVDRLIAWGVGVAMPPATETEIIDDLVREALWLADRDAATAASLFEQASQRSPTDVALRELFERLAPAPPADRGSWLAARAAQPSTEEWRGLWLLLAAWEHEQAGAFDEAFRCARDAVDQGAGELATVVRDRCRALGSDVLPFAEELWRRAEQASDTAGRKDAYERLTFLDELAQPEGADVLAWHRAYLELEPTSLPSLRRVEQLLLRQGKEAELENVFAQVARVTEGTESAAHARVAARIRLRHQEWNQTSDLVALAVSIPQPDLWALRQRFVHAMVRQDRPTLLRASQALAAKTDLAADVAVLSFRAAEAAAAEGQLAVARELTSHVLTLLPEHPLGYLLSVATLLQAGDFSAAALACEEAATVSNVPAHQAQFLYHAACLWTDHVGDRTRGCTAFEAVLQHDVHYADAMARLQSLYIERGERAKLAALLERRLEAVQDPAERSEIEVIRGRALADVGDLDGAKRVLLAALQERPDNSAALRVLADVCAQEGDWPSAEQALLRLARLTSDPAAQIDLYMRLGEVYGSHLNNPIRAEESYREVLRRRPGDPDATDRLVTMFSAAGDVDQAVQMQHTLVATATSPADKRARAVRLARIYEEVGRDLRKAESTLDALRKESPHDTSVLRALAEFHLRHQQGPAVNVLLDRTAADARRALTTGRFDLHYFANLALVFELRQQQDSARTAHGTLAALEGRPSDVQGIAARAAQGLLDDVLAPDILTPAFRSLLHQAGSALDAATMPDLKALWRTSSLPPSAQGVLELLRVMAPSFGLPPVEVHVSGKLGAVCVPVCSDPPTLVVGAPLLSDACDAVRPFLIVRALKILQRRASAFARTPPIDLWPLVASFLQLFAPQWEPQGIVETPKLNELRLRLKKAVPPSLGHDVSVLALEVIGSIGNRASTLQTAANAWGNRCALLAFGDMNLALQAIAHAAGLPNGPPPAGPERLTWVGRNAEARDLVVYSVSDAYVEARRSGG